MRRHHLCVVVVAAFVVELSLAGFLSGQNIPNSEFRDGDKTPLGWKLEDGGGRWVDHELLEVTGTGNDNSYWHCDGVKFEPGRLHQFRFRARRVGGSGSAIAGPTFANRDYVEIGPEWEWYSHAFRVPKDGAGFLRLGQWHATGAIQFDSVELLPVLPVHRQTDGMALGEGEVIRDGTYRFVGTFDHPASNYHRTLENATAGFNSNRWTLGSGQYVTYCFSVPSHPLRSGRIAFNVNYWTSGACMAEVSRDGTQWREVARLEAVGTGEAKVPDDLLPSDKLHLRFRAGPDSGFQIDRVEFEAALTGAPPAATGDTVLATLANQETGIVLEQISRRDREDGRSSVTMTLRNRGEKETPAVVAAYLGGKVLSDAVRPGSELTLAPNAASTIDVELPPMAAGSQTLTVKVGRPPDVVWAQAEMRLAVPEFYRSDYGRRFDGTSDAATVWWCDATHKIPRRRPAPQAVAEAATISAARHDYEAVQIVVRPDKPLKGLTAKASQLTGPGQAVIPAANIEILRVYYHFVEHPTDASGVRDWWPDALPPLGEPLNVAASENQPLWVSVYVPKDAAPGDYSGVVSLQAEGFQSQVPLRLRVWDFALPERNHMETAFGLSPGMIFRYHNIKSDDDRRKVLELYFESFSRHRISPYDPTPLDPIRVKFFPDADPPRAELDFSAFDRSLEKAVGKHHFTNLRLPIEGMGGGTFHERVEPRIGEYGESTPQYQAMFSSYVKQLEAHFRDKGWLEMPYIYWFDEPEPKDYDFVRRGFERLKRYAPGLRTMLTEEPVEALAGPVDIWCPLSANYDHAQAEKRRAAGDRFWWYVCTGPKAPYCTLFIDHPATELRVWHWQTWQRNIVGTLVWESNYWTSSAAFPDQPQNPYEDPMGYVSGYSTPAGVKRFWGNGDGRFIYPPLAAAVPGRSQGPVLEPPVSSIRWEMLREGVEDYEYLYLLRELIEAKRASLPPAEVTRYETLLEVPAEITKDLTRFTTDPAVIYNRRAEIAAAIEKLTR